MTPTQETSLWTAAGGVLNSRAANAPFAHLAEGEPTPASFAQQRLLVLSAFEPEPSVYNVPLAWWVHGKLEELRLRTALRDLVASHDALHCRFTANATMALDSVDGPLIIRKASSREEALILAKEELQKPLALLEGPLFRPILIDVDDGSAQLLLLIAHQIIVDGASLRLLSFELARRYCGDPVPPASHTLADFNAWQRRLWEQQDDSTAPEVRFWKDVLQQPLHPVPTPQQQLRTGETGPSLRVPFHIPQTTALELKRLGRASQTSTFVILLAALGMILHRYSGQPADVPVFVTVGGRYRPELLKMIGLLANILPFRLDLAGDPTVQTLLERISQFAAGAMANQALPLERILPWIRYADSGSRSTPVQVQFLYNNSPVPSLALPGALLTPIDDLDSGWLKPPLRLDVHEDHGAIAGHWDARADLFDPADVGSLNTAWIDLLNELSARP